MKHSLAGPPRLAYWTPTMHALAERWVASQDEGVQLCNRAMDLAVATLGDVPRQSALDRLAAASGLGVQWYPDPHGRPWVGSWEMICHEDMIEACLNDILMLVEHPEWHGMGLSIIYGHAPREPSAYSHVPDPS